jgi:hypothetical protein
VYRSDVRVDQAGTVEFAKNSHDTAGPVHVLQVHVRHRRRYLAKHRHAPGQTIDVAHRETDLALMRGRQQVKHGVGRAAHRDIEHHRVLERLEARDIAREHGSIVLLVITARQVDDQVPGLDEQPLAVGMGSEHRPVAGQSEPERLDQAIHRIRGEHAGARSAGRTGGPLHDINVLAADAVVRGRDHRVHQIDRLHFASKDDLTRLHGTAGHEHGRNIEPQRGHQHAGRDLIAVRNADEPVDAMGIGHVFDAVGDHLARRQAVEHPVMAHRDTVVDRDRIELLRNAPGLFDFPRDKLAEILEVNVPGDELRERIADCDDRLAEIGVLHAGGPPKAAGACHIPAMGGRA